MFKKIAVILLRFLFYLVASFASAVSGYYLLNSIVPKNHVFGSWFRMFSYHQDHPVSYIIIPCIFYSCMAVILGKRFTNKSFPKRILTLFAIIFFTLLLSFPVGGMLYFYHDMHAGYFPENWIKRMMDNGISAGLSVGWLIIILSFPYNLLGVIVCYFVTKAGSRISIDKQLKVKEISR